MFSELTRFAYPRDFFCGKARESEYDSFGLHILKPLEINMANSLVSYIQVGFDFEALCVHGRFDLGRCEDEHTAFSTAVSYDSVAVFSRFPLVVGILHDNGSNNKRTKDEQRFSEATPNEK